MLCICGTHSALAIFDLAMCCLNSRFITAAVKAHAPNFKRRRWKVEFKSKPVRWQILELLKATCAQPGWCRPRSERRGEESRSPFALLCSLPLPPRGLELPLAPQGAPQQWVTPAQTADALPEEGWRWAGGVSMMFGSGVRVWEELGAREPGKTQEPDPGALGWPAVASIL